MTKASDNIFTRLLVSEGGSTSTPAAGNVTVYAKANGLLYSKDDAGAETALGGGGTVSAGSNSTRVREVSTAGASTTLWSPFDHAHDGIGTITASSSNTMQRGTWNIRPGTGIVFALTDTDGDGEFDTTTIESTAGAGGGSSGTRTLVDPNTQTWAWVNQRSATVSTVGAKIYLSSVADAADSQQMRMTTVPSKPYTAIMHLEPYVWNGNFPSFGMVLLGVTDAAAWVGIGQTCNSQVWPLNTYTGNAYAQTGGATPMDNCPDFWKWLAISDTTGNRTTYVSRDGITWMTHYTVATNTTVTPTRIGFFINERNGSNPIGLLVDSFELLAGQSAP